MHDMIETKGSAAIRAVAAVVSAIPKTIAEAGEHGAPSVMLFMAMQSQGCTKSQFDMVMAVLVDCRKIHLRFDRYFIGGAK